MDFSKYAQKGNKFLKEVSAETGKIDDIESAGRLVRAVFHVLRDIISKEESLQLISQLPMALKSVYVDGWTFKEKNEQIRHIDDFINEVVKKDSPAGYCEFKSKKEALHAIESVFKVLKRYVSEGEIEDIRATLSIDLKFLCDVT